MFRLVFLVFFGKPRFDPARFHPHESPPVDDDAAGAAGDPVGPDRLVVGFPPEEGTFHDFLSRSSQAAADTSRAATEVASLYVLQEETAPSRSRSSGAQASTTVSNRRSWPSASSRPSWRWPASASPT